MKITQKQISAEAQEINKEIENPHEGDDCICRREFCLRPNEKISLHLIQCPDGYTYKNYMGLPWYRKLFAFNPTRL